MNPYLRFAIVIVASLCMVLLLPLNSIAHVPTFEVNPASHSGTVDGEISENEYDGSSYSFVNTYCPARNASCYYTGGKVGIYALYGDGDLFMGIDAIGDITKNNSDNGSNPFQDEVLIVFDVDNNHHIDITNPGTHVDFSVYLSATTIDESQNYYPAFVSITGRSDVSAYAYYGFGASNKSGTPHVMWEVTIYDVVGTVLPVNDIFGVLIWGHIARCSTGEYYQYVYPADTISSPDGHYSWILTHRDATGYAHWIITQEPPRPIGGIDILPLGILLVATGSAVVWFTYMLWFKP